MMAPGTIFSPYLALRNNSNSPLSISPTFSFDIAGNTQRVELPTINLASQQSTVLNLREVQVKGLIPADVQMGDIDLKYQGEAGALVSELASVDQHGSFVSPVPLICRGAKDSHMAFWRTDSDWHSSVTIQNLASEENEMEVTISYPGGTYVFLKRVPANTTAMLSINELQQLQIPDDSGRLIPVEAKLGGVNIWSRNLNDGLVINAMLVNPVTKTCGGCGSNGYVVSSFPAESTANNQTATGFQTHDCGDQFGIKMILTFSTGYKTQDSCSNMQCGNPTVADMSGSNMVCYDAGTTSVSGFTANPWPTSSDCSTYVPVSSFGTLPVRPKITSLSPARGVQGLEYNITIAGSGFKSGATVSVAGTGITVSGTQVGSSTEIITTFTIASNATGANHAVTVTSGGQTSAGVNFYVQIPTKLSRTGISGLIDQEGGCGAKKNVSYTLVDQAGQVIAEDLTVQEVFSDYTSDPSNITAPTPRSPQANAGQLVDEVGYETATCVQFTASLTQTFTVTIGQTTYNLSTTNSVSMGRDASGNKFVTVTNTTP